jgi:transcription initiation factor TFIID TATA-box-binding protein
MGKTPNILNVYKGYEGGTFSHLTTSKTMLVNVTNVVVMSDLKTKINLRHVVLNTRDARYDPKRFPGMIWHHRKVGGSCLLFSNGKMICHGGKTLSTARQSLRRFARCLQRMGYDVHLDIIRLLTMSVVADVEQRLNLGDIAIKMGGHYETELHNGAQFRKSTVHFNCFSSGKIIITGVKSETLMDDVVYPTLLEIQMS